MLRVVRRSTAADASTSRGSCRRESTSSTSTSTSTRAAFAGKNPKTNRVFQLRHAQQAHPRASLFVLRVVRRSTAADAIFALNFHHQKRIALLLLCLLPLHE